MVVRKTPEEIERMARAGAALAGVIEVLRDAVRPGLTTADLDALAERETTARGGVPSFLGYRGYPASVRLGRTADRAADQVRAGVRHRADVRPGFTGLPASRDTSVTTAL